jgi:hypothetical protein
MKIYISLPKVDSLTDITAIRGGEYYCMRYFRDTKKMRVKIHQSVDIPRKKPSGALGL